jgi:hypothetical protein
MISQETPRRVMTEIPQSEMAETRLCFGDGRCSAHGKIVSDTQLGVRYKRGMSGETTPAWPPGALLSLQ